MEELYIYMKHRSNKTRFRPALTLLEMSIAIAIMAVLFAVLVPQLNTLSGSWDSKAGTTEAVQNGRILVEHMSRNLSKAARITAVSDPSESNGYIEFIDNDASSYRYDVNNISSYVEFGPVGSLSDLAGPVSQLKFTCYNALDLDTPITDVNAIRCVKVETTVTNSTTLGRDMTFTTQAYIRSNTLPASGGGITKKSEPWLEFEPVMGLEPALAYMRDMDYLCAYRGDRDDGWACILTVDPTDWNVRAGGFLEYDEKKGVTPAMDKIDDGNFFCAYEGDHSCGWMSIIYEWPSGSGTLETSTKVKFEPDVCYYPALSKIDTQGDTHHFLCVYFDGASQVRFGVLEVTIVPSVMMDMTFLGLSSFWCDLVCQPALIRIDDMHHLCAYRGSNLRHWAVVLTVNPADWTVSTETPFEVVPSLYAYEPALAKIDDTHYLYALNSNIGQGCAVVLTVNTSDWTISKAMADPYYQFSDAAGSIDLCQIDSTSFLCAYTAGGKGLVTVLTVNTSDWSMIHAAPFTFETNACSEPVLCKIDDTHYLCAYAGVDDDGFVGVLELSGGIMP